MGKGYIGKFYNYSQSQIPTLSIKTTVLLPLSSQTSSYIELRITSIPYFRDKNQTNSILCSKNSIQNDLSITNNDDIQFCEKKKNCRIPTTSTQNHHAQRIAVT